MKHRFPAAGKYEWQNPWFCKNLHPPCEHLRFRATRAAAICLLAYNSVAHFMIFYSKPTFYKKSGFSELTVFRNILSIQQQPKYSKVVIAGVVTK